MYHCKLTIKGLPRLQGKLHWRTITRERAKWRNIVHWEIRGAKAHPPKLLSKAHIIFTRYSSAPPDDDNLAASFKPLRDALINDIIEDDSPDVIKKAEYRWERVKPKSGYVTIEITELA